jgi:hypothetical protein
VRHNRVCEVAAADHVGSGAGTGLLPQLLLKADSFPLMFSRFISQALVNQSLAETQMRCRIIWIDP